jgi:hypothetical protein
VATPRLVHHLHLPAAARRPGSHLDGGSDSLRRAGTAGHDDLAANGGLKAANRLNYEVGVYKPPLQDGLRYRDRISSQELSDRELPCCFLLSWGWLGASSSLSATLHYCGMEASDRKVAFGSN